MYQFLIMKMYVTMLAIDAVVWGDGYEDCGESPWVCGDSMRIQT